PPPPLVAEEEKALVPAIVHFAKINRPACCETKLVVPKRGLHHTGFVRKKVVGIQLFILQVVVGATMKNIVTGFDPACELNCAPSVLCWEVMALDLVFVNCIQNRNN